MINLGPYLLTIAIIDLILLKYIYNQKKKHNITFKGNNPWNFLYYVIAIVGFIIVPIFSPFGKWGFTYFAFGAFGLITIAILISLFELRKVKKKKGI
jgi:hypothetical protein